MKTSELTGASLDYWVARAIGLSGIKWRNGEVYIEGRPLGTCWSTMWEYGGPIIERERIATVCIRTNNGEYWQATVNGDNVGPDGQVESSNEGMHNDGEGPTLLIAAMRAKVASKYGDEVQDET